MYSKKKEKPDRSTYRGFRYTHRFKRVSLHAVRRPTAGRLNLRALAIEPDVLFLDEPFSALDYEMTLLMREKLQSIFEKTKTTMILVSHDLEEAVQMADKVLLLSRRPTRVAALVDNLLPRPRDAGTLTEPAFVDLRSECLKIFQKEALVNELSN